ncbi:ZFYVE26 [Cordylochernes scorpioides]|uniref:ZFYVE26 n=1 Tax=Cordylochernes scorpioides TaxID=51811 RepID=A0ABY6L213_9ARAC|nr:ZFYVE26 [Cordylochernes scorpioides]
MEGHQLAQEVVFADEMTHLRKQVGTLARRGTNNHQNGHISQIVQLATENRELFSSHSAVEEMLCKVHIPEYGNNLCDRQAMVLIDLATTTSNLPAHISTLLLDVALHKLTQQETSGFQNLTATVEHLLALSRRLTTGQSLAKALTLGLASQEAQARAEVWPQLADTLNNFRDALADKSQELVLSGTNHHPPHVHFQSVLRFSSKLIAPVSRPLNYLQALFDRLKYVTTALLQCRIQSHSQDRIPRFIVLNHKQELMFVPDLGKEKVVLEDLRRLVLQRRSEVEQWMEETSELAAVDLNLAQEPVGLWSNVASVAWLHGILYPLVVGHTPGLASPYSTERLVHHCLLGYRVGQAGLLTLADLRLRILRWDAPLPAALRHFPALTFLLDLTKTHLEDVQKYFPKFEPRLLFVLPDGFGHSPILQVLHTISLQEDLANATTQYLTQHVTIGTECGDKKEEESSHTETLCMQVRVPQVLVENVEDFAAILSTDLPAEDPLRSCLEPLLPASGVTEWLSPGQKSSAAKHQMLDVVVLEPRTADFCLVLEYTEDIDTTGEDAANAVSAKIPGPMEEFLAERSPLALTLVGLAQQPNSKSSLTDSGLRRWLESTNEELQSSLSPVLSEETLWRRIEKKMENGDDALELLWMAEEQLGSRAEFYLLRDAILGSSSRPLAISSPILRTPCILNSLSQCDYSRALVHLQACDPALAAPALAHLRLFHQVSSTYPSLVVARHSHDKAQFGLVIINTRSYFLLGTEKHVKPKKMPINELYGMCPDSGGCETRGHWVACSGGDVTTGSPGTTGQTPVGFLEFQICEEKMTYFRHIMRENGLEKMLEKIEGKERKTCNKLTRKVQENYWNSRDEL